MTPPRKPPLPTAEQVLQFIRESPGRVGKREIARAFHLSGDDRRHLKDILKELAEAGHIERGAKRRFARPGSLPPVMVLEAHAQDSDGSLLARPLAWEGDTPPPRIVVLPDRRLKPEAGVGDRLLARLEWAGGEEDDDDDSPPTYNARPIRRLASGPREVLGIYEMGSEGGRLRPTDRREKSDYIVTPGNAGGASPGALVLAEALPRRGRALGLPVARITEVLGDIDHPGAVSLIAIHTHGIPHQFPAAVLAEAEAAQAPTPEGRSDLTDLPLVTIDGADARDFDDAVFAAPDDDPANPGGWRVVVAIADVAAYVRPGSELDLSARERGNSVYFPDRVVPMLPEALSNGWCSLKPHEPRGCLAVTMTFDATGEKRAHRFARGLMRSAARLTYEQVQAAVDGAPDETTGPLVEPVLKPLYGAWKALAEARQRRGALELDLPERRVVVDDAGHVVDIVPRARLDSHRLIEDFMIAANVAAAEQLEAVEQPCMYRVHDRPADDRLENLRTFLASLNLTLAHGQDLKPQKFNQILSKVKGAPHEALVNTVVLRAQSQAVYSPENLGHFGLGLARYAHFTSPIRRYADLLVHRALVSGLGLQIDRDGLPPDAPEAFEEVAAHISMTERRAANAERSAVDRFTTRFLADRVGADFTAKVSGVTRAGLFVSLADTGADGLIPISTLTPADFYRHDEDHHRLVGQRTRRTFSLGQTLTVRLIEAEPLTGSLIFALRPDPKHQHPEKTPAKGSPRHAKALAAARRARR
ncbi:ribonuclease R [Roseospirillum parvum]|uniref:Ribonuclease R n=1 Tax=Roseospirillum parvum TaxID=83401 RepID=A0A1G7VAZ0_9PROT|nr:ribonuclease R [Roseospirillum parvum]SDG56982.1 ribonuclease R [Roseospirillum parvum]